MTAVALVRDHVANRHAWSDWRLITCKRCGHRMFATIRADVCDACLIGRR